MDRLLFRSNRTIYKPQMTYEEAVQEFKDVPRPSLEEFIKVGKKDFIYFEKLYGAGFILHAIEIAEMLKEKNETNRSRH